MPPTLQIWRRRIGPCNAASVGTRWRTGGLSMLATQDRKRDKARMVADDVVTANSLATHFGCTRQNIARLTAEAVIEQRSDGGYDQTASRLRYIKHLRSDHQRSPRTQADADHIKAKTEML